MTRRELDVLSAMAEGKTNAAIATTLHLSDSAVEKHINAIFAKLDLQPEAAVHRRVAGEGRPSLVGATGTALSDLRPSGVADIDGARVDVVTSGEYLRRGEAVEVIRDDGYRRVVRRREP